jgi:hypothetical protein
LSAIVAASIGADVERLTGGSMYCEWPRVGGHGRDERGRRGRDTCAHVHAKPREFLHAPVAQPDLLADIKNAALSGRETRDSRDSLARELEQAYVHAPRTGSKAYQRARKALKMEEEFTFSAEEVDPFLPGELRIGAGKKSG